LRENIDGPPRRSPGLHCHCRAWQPDEPPPIPLNAVWPASRVLPAKTRLFIDFLAAELQKQEL
jgi:DNA-binding transcriptional LysR family regulator